MNELDEFTYISELFAIYGSLLTEKQQEIMENYFNFNLSLNELSEELGISRSAVGDAIEHSKEKLYKYEENLHLYKRNKDLVEEIEKLGISEEEKKKLIGVIYGI